jgi:hypothetical protein
MEKKYFKVVDSIHGNHGLFYHEGINVDPLPFKPRGNCEDGGLYFSSEDIFDFYAYGDIVYEVKPIGEVYENPGEPKKWKAHALDMKLIGKKCEVQTIKYLIDNGISLEENANDILYLAIIYNQLPVIKYCVEQGVNVHDKNENALRQAAFWGNIEIVKYLVEQGADIHMHHESALRNAADYGILKIVKYLVEHGANVHANDDYALRCAADYGYLDMIKYLVEHGADIHADNDYAIRNSQGEVNEYLLSLI